MRSLFKTLKTRRVSFTNPTAGLELHRQPPPPALALDPTRRAGLLDQLHRPDQRLIVLLAGVHALRPHQIRVLALDDVDLTAGTLAGGRSAPPPGRPHPRRAGRLAGASPCPLASQRQPLPAGQPEHRRRVHPGHPRLCSAGFAQLGLTAQDLRADRLLAEVQATGGDPLKLTEFFGISDPTAIRYRLELDPLDQANQPRQHREFAELTTTDPPDSLQ